MSSSQLYRAERVELPKIKFKNIRSTGNKRGINVFIRMLAIDARLRKKPYPSMLDLVQAVEEKLECEVGVRTIQLDLNNMRYHNGLGAFAPIEFVKLGVPNFYYHYTNPEYSFIQALVKINET